MIIVEIRRIGMIFLNINLKIEIVENMNKFTEKINLIQPK